MEERNGVCEIVEVGEGSDAQIQLRDKRMSKQKQVYSVEDDINSLFQAIELRPSIREDNTCRNRMKRPMRASTSQASGIGIPESSNLKQALRGLCISQASEMAALKRRSLKLAGLAGVSDAGTTKRLYRAVVAEANESGQPSNEWKGNVVEISLPNKVVPEEIHECAEVSMNRLSNQSRHSSPLSVDTFPPKTRILRPASQDKVVPLPSDTGGEPINPETEQKGKQKATRRSKGVEAQELTGDKVLPSKADASSKSTKQAKCRQDKAKICEDLSLEKEDEIKPAPCSSSSSVGDQTKKSPSSSPCLIKLALRNKNFVMRKGKVKSTLASCASSPSVGNIDDTKCHSTGELDCSKKLVETSSYSVENTSSEVSSGVVDSAASKKVASSKAADLAGNNVAKPEAIQSAAKSDGILRPKEKGEISQSSKSSMGDFSSSTTSISGGSSLSGSSRSGNRPHMSKDFRWEAIGQLLTQDQNLSLRHFKLLRRLGSGDIGTVYLAQLIGTNCLFALKVMDNEFLARRKKLSRAQTEREILQMLDHPFLPTLYSHFSSDKLSCLVMEFCPGGDLHVLRQKQPARNFSEQAARFYAAEVLLALEYLHMLGVIYRDLKPENILVREDGHIMLSDFDLSLKCEVNPTVLRSTSPNLDHRRKTTSCTQTSCIDPFCLQPSWQGSCFTPRLLTDASKSRKLKSDDISLVTFPQLVAEPTDARSNSFVGTHEYLAPEIIKGDGHGSAVDWWTLGIFLYELLYAKTPFRGLNNDETVANVMSKPLRFPDSPIVSFYARDLIRGLLIKEPENRLGFVKGAAEIKNHPFFEGLNWALIRCAVPPERPKCCDVGSGGKPSKANKKGNDSALECVSSDRIEFDLF